MGVQCVTSPDYCGKNRNWLTIAAPGQRTADLLGDQLTIRLLVEIKEGVRRICDARSWHAKANFGGHLELKDLIMRGTAHLGFRWEPKTVQDLEDTIQSVARGL